MEIIITIVVIFWIVIGFSWGFKSSSEKRGSEALFTVIALLLLWPIVFVVKIARAIYDLSK